MKVSHLQSSKNACQFYWIVFCTWDAFHISNSIRCFWASVCSNVLTTFTVAMLEQSVPSSSLQIMVRPPSFRITCEQCRSLAWTSWWWTATNWARTWGCFSICFNAIQLDTLGTSNCPSHIHPATRQQSQTTGGVESWLERFTKHGQPRCYLQSPFRAYSSVHVECSVINMVFPRVITSKMCETFTNDKGIQ